MAQKKRSSARKPRGKPKTAAKKGHGMLPHAEGQPNPVMMFVRSDPLHTREEWERIGRPLWLLRFTEVPYGKTMLHVFARTKTPTCHPFAAVVQAPYRAHAIEGGVILPTGETGERMEPMEWQDVMDQTRTMKVVRKLGSPEGWVLSWDRILTRENAQSYWNGDTGIPGERPYRGPARPSDAMTVATNVAPAVERNTAPTPEGESCPLHFGE